MTVTSDDVVLACGDFGKFQKRILILLSLLILPTSITTYMPIFILTVPDHRCALQGFDNDTFLVQNDDHLQFINASIPLEDGTFSQCLIHTSVVMNSGPANSVLGNQSQEGNVTSQLVACSRWVYDKTSFDRTMIEEFDLVCDNKDTRSHANMAMMTGKMFAAVTQGYLSDMFGRKRTLTGFIVVLIIANFVNAFVFNIPSLMAFRFLSGISSTSIFVGTFVLGVELISPSHRRFVTVLLNVMWILGGFLLLLVAYFVRDYQTLLLVIAAPSVLFMSYSCLVPESPRWLLTKGRVEEARQILEKIATTNNKEFPDAMFWKMAATEFKIQSPDVPEPITKDTDEKTAENTQVATVVKRETIFTLLRNRTLAMRWIIVVFNWAVISLMYYALMFNVTNLAGSIYLNFFILNCVDITANIAAYFVVDRFGRKWSYGGFLLMATVACLAGVLPHIVSTPAPSVINGLSMVGRAGAATSYTVVYLFSSELFPTSLRNSAMGSFSMGSRISSIFAPYIADLGLLIGGSLADVLPLIVCGSTGLIALLASLVLPETVGNTLPNNIQDAAAIGRKSKGGKKDLDKSCLEMEQIKT